MTKTPLSVIEENKVNLDIHCGYVNRILTGRQKADTVLHLKTKRIVIPTEAFNTKAAESQSLLLKATLFCF